MCVYSYARPLSNQSLSNAGRTGRPSLVSTVQLPRGAPKNPHPLVNALLPALAEPQRDTGAFLETLSPHRPQLT